MISGYYTKKLSARKYCFLRTFVKFVLFRETLELKISMFKYVQFRAKNACVSCFTKQEILP